ncbi:MAG: hypothetical protein HY042_09925 [Spirochaetia bacterium]|nr:hypothetical protein [Spirochaetia bacterium]
MKRLCVGLFALAAFVALVPNLKADGCYGCGSGSSASCKDYCRYSGEDTWDNRHKCEALGCKIASTTSDCSASNYVVCTALHIKPWSVDSYLAMLEKAK